MNGEKEDQPNGHGWGPTAEDMEASREARAIAVKARETEYWAATEYWKRADRPTPLSKKDAQGALARVCLEATFAAAFLEAAADAWEAGEQDLAREFDVKADHALLEVLAAREELDGLREMETERQRGAPAHLGRNPGNRRRPRISYTEEEVDYATENLTV